MKTKIALQIILSLSFTWPVTAQFETKLYEFPKYGFQIPFFVKHKQFHTNKGKPDELIEYIFEDTLKRRTYARLAIYPNVGCTVSDSFYAQSERYVKYHPQRPFRITTSAGVTYIMGWMEFSANATVDIPGGGPSKPPYREVQCYTNGRVMVLIDIIWQEEGYVKEYKRIMEDPGFRSILLPVPMPAIQLKFFVRGNVTSLYEAKEKTYYLGRCDKLGTMYPYVTVRRIDGSVASNALATLGEARKTPGISDAKLETKENQGPLSKLDGPLHSVSYQLSATDSKGMRVHYYFSFRQKIYELMLSLPFMPNDNKLYWWQKNEFTTEHLPIFDERIVEWLQTMEAM